ncbi:thiopeptide-type bacteriocin biosynthesis protein [Streptomyces sp. NPDC003077]|uniref:thiopeptide-type bacteriocin biosynthesis protein n=1 Tax=Streptomyces sp. NPDC003077 TaxID=3154443 RepID=UPI0033B02E25
MHQQDTNPAEEAVLSVLAGIPIETAAKSTGTSTAWLTRAVERYRAAGRATLDAHLTGWHQMHIQFSHYPTAARVFRAHLLPALGTNSIGTWWFVRKYPCWRLRVHPAPGATTQQTAAHLAEALDNTVSSGAIQDWWSSPYEPETVAFGGPIGMTITHDLFHADSTGILAYLHHSAIGTAGMLDAKATSFLVTAAALRAAGLEWGEQGDVWGQLEVHRPLPEDTDPEKVTRMVQPLRRLLKLDPDPFVANGPLAPIQNWVGGVQRGARALADTARSGRLQLGLRGILARHVLFHWNRMGFTTQQQAIWSRAAREATLGR